MRRDKQQQNAVRELWHNRTGPVATRVEALRRWALARCALLFT